MTSIERATKIVDDWKNYIMGDRQRAALASNIVKAIDNERERVRAQVLAESLSYNTKLILNEYERAKEEGWEALQYAMEDKWKAEDAKK